MKSCPGITLEKQTTQKIFSIRNQKTNHPFQAYLKPRQDNTTEQKLLPKFLEQFIKTQILESISCSNWLLGYSSCLFIAESENLVKPFSAAKINFFGSIFNLRNRSNLSS